MAFFSARITCKDGVVVAENVSVWIHVFRDGDRELWDGSFELPAVQFTAYLSTYQIHLADGRQGKIVNLNSFIRGDNLTVYFEGSGPLA